MSEIDVKVPDLGDFSDVDVIEIYVSVGDELAAEDPLIALETDKAAMDVPSPRAGKVRSIAVKVGDKVSPGDPIVTLVTDGAAGEGAGEDAGEGADGAADGVSADDEDGAAEARTANERSRDANARDGRRDETKPAAGQAGRRAAPSAPRDAARPGAAASAARGATGAAPAETRRRSVGGEGAQPAPPGPRLVVLGSGPGGYTAAFRAADLGLDVTLVERYPTLGGVCLNVGCIPSKALLHAARVVEEAREVREFGIDFGNPAIDTGKLRAWKNAVVGQMTKGLDGLAKRRKIKVVQGYGRFISANTLAVEHAGRREEVEFDQCIIAAGSDAARIPDLPDDPRIMDSTGALELAELPARLLVIGGGIIGLEMATVYEALGVKVSVVELTDTLMPGCDRDLVKPLEKRIAARYEAILLGTRVTRVEALAHGIEVTFDGKQAPAEPQVYGRVLVAVGRRPNGSLIDAVAAGVAVTERGFVEVDKQMRTNVPHIFAIGDIVGPPMLAHKASHEGRVAAEAASGQKSFFDARVVPSVAYTDPEVAWVGLTEDEAKAAGTRYEKGVFPWAASGRSLSLGRSEGMTKLLFDPDTRRLLGAGIVGTSAGDLIAETALAIELGCDAEDIGLTIHPHPTLSETIAFAAEVAEGTVTDLYAPKR